MVRVGQNRIYAPYMTVYLVISLPKTPYIHRIYMVLANPTHGICMLTAFRLFTDGGRGVCILQFQSYIERLRGDHEMCQNNCICKR